jgi:murein DD-endopeptidase MepM/ murein hydrolase activator NlpD
MRFLRKNVFWLFLFCLVAVLISAPSPQTARTRLADGFDQPVGKPDAEGYYRARGFRPNYHMGDDWNGLEGGNSDRGKPVYSIANGIVVLARDMRMGWGNLVIIRHAFLENKQMKTVDSVYAHLDKILVRENQQVVRGQQVGNIGTAHGLYPAHLHFEIRKNLAIGYNQRGFPKDFTNYYSPVAFIEQHRKLAGGGRSALVAINTFNLDGKGTPPSDESLSSSSSPTRGGTAPSSNAKKQPYRVNRFGDMF